MVTDAVAASLRSAVSNRQGAFASSVRAESIVDAARLAVADLTGADLLGVILGPNMTTLTLAVSRALEKTWSRGDEVVVSRLDHDANVRPWVIAADRVGATVRWADIDPESCTLAVSRALENRPTRTSASNSSRRWSASSGSRTGAIDRTVVGVMGPDAAERWKSLSLTRRRAVIATLLERIVILPACPLDGGRGF